VPRRLQIPSVEIGVVQLYLIYSYSGAWEQEWAPMKGVLDLPVVSRETMDHALRGWTRPLVDGLGPAPAGRLLLMPRAARDCALRATCRGFDAKRCGALLRKMPWCFEPDGVESRLLVTEVINLWRDEVYVVVVEDQQ
jgi:hypothetical protein